MDRVCGDSTSKPAPSVEAIHNLFTHLHVQQRAAAAVVVVVTLKMKIISAIGTEGQCSRRCSGETQDVGGGM